MTDHLSQIKQALEAGPTEGLWVADIPSATEHFWARDAMVRAEKWGVVATIGIDTSLPHWDKPQRANAALIAACNPTAIRYLIERLEAAERDAQAKQAKIDALMLEYFPDEMTPEQVEEWGRHQVPASGLTD